MSRGKGQQFPSSASSGLRRTPPKQEAPSEPKPSRQPEKATEQYLLELCDETTGLVYVKRPPAWGENRVWQPIGSVRLAEGHRSKLIKGLAGVAIGEIEATELEEIRDEFGSE